jgi:hypothetical protein
MRWQRNHGRFPLGCVRFVAYLQPGKVDARGELGRRFKHGLQGFLVAEIDFMKD